MEKKIQKLLVESLETMIEAWEYNGGGDKWCRECYGERIKKAERVLKQGKKALK